MKLFKRLFGGKRQAAPVALEGMRVFAVGDIHGCDRLLDGLLLSIQKEVADDPVAPILIFLGDYVDRGPGSREVIDRLLGLAEDGWNARFLAGNHEEAMLKFLADVESGMAWPDYGGRATMASYGVASPEDTKSLEGWRETQVRFKAALPEQHQRFLWKLEDRVELGDYLFVHAGVRPDRKLADQNVKDLRWIREPFLSDSRVLEKIIVHGHSPTKEPHEDHRRIGIDTWAYRSGVLTAVELNGEDRRFWQARYDGERVIAGPRDPAPRDE